MRFGDCEVYVAIHQKKSYEINTTNLLPGDIPGSIRWAQKGYKNAKSCPYHSLGGACHEDEALMGN